jgi:hypothetical protein
MLGSLSEAEDAVQEGWLRLNRSDTSAVENLSGWLTTVVARVCLDMLRSRKSKHEESLEEHTEHAPDSSPAARAAASRERPRLPTPISPASEKLSMPSSLPRAAVTSRRFSRYSTPTPYSDPIPLPYPRAHPQRSAAQQP